MPLGVCELPPYAVYSHKFDFRNPDAGEVPIELDHKYAIAVLVDQDYRTSQAYTGNDWISNAMSMMSYATSGFIAIILAEYIRRLGYPAKAHYAPFYDIVLPPILLWAGLGEMSRIGDTVVHPFIGPRHKGAVVTTDLPLLPDKPIDFGLQDFCSKCKKCARECPSGAISDGEKVLFNGYENGRWTSRNARTCGSAIKRDQAAAPASRFAPGASHPPLSTDRSTGPCGMWAPPGISASGAMTSCGTESPITIKSGGMTLKM